MMNSKIKASELKAVVEDFINYYLQSDANSSVILGCDCGCGGDSYTPESWTRMCDTAEECREAFEGFCKQYNIEWDY